MCTALLNKNLAIPNTLDVIVVI